MSLLCFSMDFTLDEDEAEKTSAITSSAYDAWVLVNDYFSWEKEWQNHQANGGVGVIANAIFLFMRWYSVDATEGKRMLRKEILAREEKYCKEKEQFMASGHATDRTSQWLKLLDHVTAGNFAWSMTTARYRLGGEDAYPALRAAHGEDPESGLVDSLSQPISLNAANMAKKMDVVLKERKYMDRTTSEDNVVDSAPIFSDTQLIHSNREGELVHSQTDQPRALTQYEEVSTTSPTERFEILMILQIVLQPQHYIDSMPSKGVRNSVIDGLEMWYQVPERSLAIIREIVNLLHSSSLMLVSSSDRGLGQHLLIGILGWTTSKTTPP